MSDRCKMTRFLLVWLLAHLAHTANSEIAGSGPLVYHSWPPSQSNRVMHHMAQQQTTQQSQASLLHRQHHTHHHHPHSAPQMIYHPHPMRTQSSASASSGRYPTSGIGGQSSMLQSSPSNIVYAQQKLRPQQSMAALINLQQHNRLLRPGLMKVSSAAANKPNPYPFVSSSATSHYANKHAMMATRQKHPHQLLTTTTAGTTFVKTGSNGAATKNFGVKKPHTHSVVDYVFENPMMPHHSPESGPAMHPNQLFASTTVETFVTRRPQRQQPAQQVAATKYSPIHTIQAPNLSLHEQKPFASLLNKPLLDDNNLFEKDSMFPSHMAFSADRPTSVPQYQVTESTNDHAVRHNSPPLFVPDSHTPLVANVVQQPQHLSYSETPFSSSGNQAAASALVPHQLSFPSPSSDVTSYVAHPATRNGGTPMAAPYTAQLNAVPLSAYNPTYLVTQSNQLLDQHKQHLFKPDRHYIHHHQPQQQQQQQYQHHPIETEFLPSFQLPSGDYVSLQTVAQAPTNMPQSQNVSPPQQSAALSIQEVSNLLSFGTMQSPVAAVNSPKNGFIASRYYQSSDGSTPSQSNTYDETIFHHQQQNEERINAANRQALLSAQQAIDTAPYATSQPETSDSTIFVTRSPEQRASEAEAESAHQRHQQRLAEHSNTDMRIYVPDEDYSAEQSDTFHKRSDDFAMDNVKADSDSEASPTTSQNISDVTKIYDQGETLVFVTESNPATKRIPVQMNASLDTSTPNEMSVPTLTSIAAENNNDNAIIVQDNQAENVTASEEAVEAADK